MSADDPSRGPLFVLAIVPTTALFGAGPHAALIYNAVLGFPFLLACSDIAWQLFGTVRARLIVIPVVGWTPLIVGLQHEVLVDFQLVALAAFAIALLIRSDGFARSWLSAAVGLAIGLGTLTKVTFPAFVLVPATVVLLAGLGQALRQSGGGETETGHGVRWRLANLVLAVGVTAAVVLPWYGPNRAATVAYIRSTTSGPLSEGAGPEHPLTLHNMASFVTSVVDYHLSWLLVAIGVVALLACLPRFVSQLARPVPSGRMWFTLAVLVGWTLPPFLLLLTGHNQDVRLMAPAVAGFAVLVVGLVTNVPWRRLQAALAVVLIFGLGLQTWNRTWPLPEVGLPQSIRTMVGTQLLWQPVASDAPIGYQQLPQRDLALPIVRYLEARARQKTSANPPTVCLLESDPLVNANTFGYYFLTRHDPFALSEVQYDPANKVALRTTLAACSYAVFIRPERDASPEDRLTIVNEPFAASHMTPRRLALFDGPRRSFATGSAPIDHHEDDPGSQTHVVVLSHEAESATP